MTQNFRSSTLCRRPHGEGQSYAGIRREIRRDLAVRLLRNGKGSVADIAMQLGYSEPSAFRRETTLSDGT